MSNLLELYRRSTGQFGSRVAQIRDDQWELPTPCTEWNVRALVRHLVYEDLWFAPLMHGETIAQVGDRFEGDILGDDPKAAWGEASEAALATAAEPGAFERTVNLSRGDTPAEVYVWELILDHTVHGWDLARGIGADETMDAEIAERLYANLLPVAASLQQGGAFAAPVPVPDDAGTPVKLLALLGRKA
ncbi:MAG TPA: TIGR03086 family metal-binding protein [Actinomycetota bacterium]